MRCKACNTEYDHRGELCAKCAHISADTIIDDTPLRHPTYPNDLHWEGKYVKINLPDSDGD